jgi:hypothetical protein
MSNRPPRRTLVAWGALLVAIVAVVLIARFATRGSNPAIALAAAPRASRLSHSDGPAPPPAAPAAPGEHQPKKETFPLPACWQGVLDFDQSASLALAATCAMELLRRPRGEGVAWRRPLLVRQGVRHLPDPAGETRGRSPMNGISPGTLSEDEEV